MTADAIAMPSSKNNDRPLAISLLLGASGWVAGLFMLAFGVPEDHDEPGLYIDSRNANWDMMVNPNSTFSASAANELLTKDFKARSGGLILAGRRWSGRHRCGSILIGRRRRHVSSVVHRPVVMLCVRVGHRFSFARVLPSPR